ncbi:MAG: uracil-DNA glycosylase [Candidatus Latescibacteria bacterium]|nr:uracil-DNA glycosylase [Candidatus Latescibacterota bacterium]
MDARHELAELVRLTVRAVAQQKDNGIESVRLPDDLTALFTDPRAVTPPAASPAPRSDATSLQALYDANCTCTKCPLGHTRRHFVFGSGNEHAEVMFIGEAPGAEEDAQGLPFVGAAGQLLTKILEAIKFNRDEVYIANIVKCRPPNNREPRPEEMAACEPILREQIRLIQPKLICALGRVAGQALLRTTAPLGRLRGTFHDYHGIKVLVTYHPAALLRDPSLKRPTWEDVQKLRREYDQLMEFTTKAQRT